MKKENHFMKNNIAVYPGENTCIICGASIPEGLMVCPACECGDEPARCQICHCPVTAERTLCPSCEKRFASKT